MTFDFTDPTYVQWITQCAACGPLVVREPRLIPEGGGLDSIGIGKSVCGRCGKPVIEMHVRIARPVEPLPFPVPAKGEP